MPTDIIAIHEREMGGLPMQTCNARDLHGYLAVRRDFSNWIKCRIKQYGFEPGLDFEVFAEFGENVRGGRPGKEYALSLDMAKELAMVERGEKGKQARRYFIECERRARAVSKPTPDINAQLNNPATLKRLLLAQADTNIHLAPRAMAMERFERHDGSHRIRDAGQLLGIGERRLVAWLLANSWCYRDTQGRLCAYAATVAAGHLDTVPRTINRAHGIEVIAQVKVTQRGLTRIAMLLAKEALEQKTEELA